MSDGQLPTLIQYLRRLSTVDGGPCPSDADLLRRFTSERDAVAFELLVRRHGPMVLGLCRRLMHDDHDVEDAFQATFLALVRKAASVGRGEALGAWLHKVAYRVALAVRSERRGRREQSLAEAPAVVGPSDPYAEAAWRELRSVLDQEVGRLPRRYREAFVLCCLTGKSNAEAARELGCPVGTVESRLARARARLRGALLRRGFAPAAVALAAAPSPSGASPAALPVARTVSAAQSVAAGEAASGPAALADKVLLSMSTSRLKTVALLILGVSLLAATAGMRGEPSGAENPTARSDRPAATRPSSADPPGEQPAASAKGPRTDRFGDPLPPGALVRMGTVRYAQGDAMDGYPVLAPDRKTFATVSLYTPYRRGRVVCLWDAATGKELRHLDDPDFEPYRAFFLKSENLLGTLGVSRKPVEGQTYAYAVHFWDPATGKKVPAHIQVLGYPFEPWALSPDEKWLASARREPPVQVRDRKTGKVVAEWKGDGTRVDHLAFSPDGKTLAVCCGSAIHLWDWTGRREARRLGDFAEPVERVWFSPDGRRLAAAVGKEGLRIWETNRWAEVQRIAGAHDVRFFPDGKRLVSTATGVVWDVLSGKQVGRWESCAHCLALDFSPDGRTATGYALGRIRRWDADTGKDRSPPAPTAPRVMVHQVGFLPGGKEVVSASPDGAVRVWDATTGKELRTLVRGTVWDQKSTFMRLAPDGTIVVARGNRLSFFPREGKAEEVALTGFSTDGLAGLDLSPDGKTLILAASNRLIQVWDLPGRKIVARFAAPEGAALETLGVSADRQIAASVGRGISLLNVSGTVSRTLEKAPEAPRMNRGKGGDEGGAYSYFPGVQALTFSPDGEVLASAGHPGGALKLLDMFSGKPRHVLLRPARENQHYELRNAVFSPDGRMIAAESEPGVVDVWETSTGQRRRRFRGHRSYQTTLAFSPDGARLATGNRDATILVWDVFGLSTGNPPDAVLASEADLEALWARLLDGDGERACLAMGRLMRCPGLSAPFLSPHLLARKSPEAARLRGWIADLDDEHFHKRETAANELAKHLASAEPLLKETLAGNPSPEARRRLAGLLSRAEPRPLSPETLRDLRALEVLEHLGPAAAAKVARELSEGPYDPWVAAAAKAVRKRLTTKLP
jgi:RNA polymerase sigma factor (sigma-70 family)